MQYFRTTAALLFILHLAGCADAPLSSHGDTGRLAPERVDVIDVGAGQRLTRINFEDGQVDSAASQWNLPGLHRHSYAAQGIAIDSALFEIGSVYYHLARSGYNWIGPRQNTAAYPVGFSPILISFDERVGGSVRGVRIHVARLYPGFNFPQPYAPYTLTCYEGQTPIGTASATPPTLYDGPLTYVPLEVRGSNISRCVIQPHAYFLMDDVEVTVARADLQLECVGNLGENRVTRGEKIACTPKIGTEDGEIEVVSWSFAGTDSRGQPYRFPEDVDGPVTGSVWRGQMAISGTVTVQARVNGGEPQEISVDVSVQPRSWENACVEASVRKVGWEEFPADRRPALYPTNPRDLGRTSFSARPIPLGSDVYTQIDDYGPNHYLLFLKRIPVELDIRIVVHPEMETQGEFWRRQSAGQPAYERAAGCLRSQFGRYVDLILAHEGYPPNPRSHSGVYIAEFSERAGPLLEDLVYPDTDRQAFADEIDVRLVPAYAQAFAAADQPVDQSNPVRFGCSFNFAQR